MGRLVWAFEPLDETGGQTGFVEIEDEALAERLIDAGKVQCGWNPEGGELKYIDERAVATYATRQLKAGGARATKPVEREDPPELPEDPEPPATLLAPAEDAPSAKKRGRPPRVSSDA